MLWLWWLKTGKNNKLKLSALNIFENKVNKRKKTQLKTLEDREKNNKTTHATENRIRLKTYYFWDQLFKLVAEKRCWKKIAELQYME